MAGLPAEVAALVAGNAHFSATPEGKVKCELNGHTFPPKADVLQAFINGKKFAKLVKAAELDKGLGRYEPFIVRSKNLPDALFCALTGELLNARLHEVQQHLKGKKFQRAKERFEADEQELLEEPDLEGGSDMEEDGTQGSDGPGVWVPEDVLQEYEMEDGGAEGAGAGTGEGGAAANGSAAAAEEQGGGKGKAAAKQQKPKPRKGAAAAGGEAAAAPSGKGKQQQKQQAASDKAAQNSKPAAATNGAAAGKGKAPKAKRVRTG